MFPAPFSGRGRGRGGRGRKRRARDLNFNPNPGPSPNPGPEQSIDGPTDKDQVFKVRLPFPRAAEDRKDVKTLIVEMTRTSLANPVVQEAMQAVIDEDARKEKAKAAA